ncbi:MAG: RNA polymerase factor sigma-54 [Luteibaculaceae bacterium]
MLKQTLSQKLLQKLSPQQIQLMKLLQVTTLELEQRIKSEIEENPALEEGEDDYESDEDFSEGDNEFDNTNDDDTTSENDNEREFDIDMYFDDDTPDYKLHVNNKSADDEERQIPFASGKSFHEHLLDQLALKNIEEELKTLAEYLIGNLDDDGYLRRELKAIVNDLLFSQNKKVSLEQLQEALKVVQDLEPTGIGARSLQECLIIQLQKNELKDEVIHKAIHLLEAYFEQFTKKHYDKIMAKMDIEEEELKDIIEEITRLNPKPGGSLKESNTPGQTIIPDFILMADGEELTLNLNQRNAPDLRISNGYKDLLKTYHDSKKKDKNMSDAYHFVKQKIDAAKWFIDAINQRQQTLTLTMQAIAEYQKDYFITGDETKLKPMILKDIADKIGLDISTISRVVNSKYVRTNYGTFLLKTFFSESLSTDSGEEVSTREVKKILQDNIDAEDKSKPLTDEALAALLNEKGYNIARRTVAKYREQLGLPVARLRKEL